MASFLTAWKQLDDGRDRSEFYRMWLSGASAGFTVPKIMELMGPRGAPQVEGVRRWLLDGTSRGDDVTSIVKRGGARFESFERALLLLGDESGTMEQSLRLLAEFYHGKYRLMLAVRKQMAYPLFTGIIATFVAPFSLLYFGHAGSYVAIVALGLTAWVLAGGSIVLWAANHYGRKPRLVRARLARALATAIEAGLPLPRAIRLAASASADPDVERFVAALDERALTAQSVAGTLSSCPHMSPDFSLCSTWRSALEISGDRLEDWRCCMRMVLMDEGSRGAAEQGSSSDPLLPSSTAPLIRCSPHPLLP